MPPHRWYSINFNGQFIDDDHQSLIYVSERTGSSQVYLTCSGSPAPQQLPSSADSLFHDRLIIKNECMYFISTHKPADQPFKSWSTLYSTALDDTDKKIVHITPHGSVDYSPTITSNGSRPWLGEFHDLQMDIFIFPISDSSCHVVIC